jgi:tetratricopeptide (TPR) repeat protein
VAEQIKFIGTKNAKGKIIAIWLIVLALIFGWFSVSWQIGNMLASLTPPNAPNAKEIAEVAKSLSSRDPMTNWFLGSINNDDFTPDGLTKSVEMLEQTVRNAPYDYRFWMELGRGYERAERYEQAEKAFQRAVDLAPNYSAVHWQLGNFYLRQDRKTEAIAELRKSAETSSIYSMQVFGTAWDYFDKDTKKLNELAGNQMNVRADLAKFYASKELASESLQIWNTLLPEEKQAKQDVAKIIAQALYEKRFYRSAISFVHQLAIEPEAKAETIQNGGFESPIAEDANKAYFNWKISRLDKVEIKLDSGEKREGKRSLRVNFNGFTGIEVKNIAQVVAVESGKHYVLSFWIKTDNLKSAGTPTIEIVNANDFKIIPTTSPAFPTGTNDWGQVKIEFNAPSSSEGVWIRLDRAYCGDACPIVGTIWLDEFKLEAK